MFKMSILPYLVTLSLYFYFGKSIDTKFTEKNILTLLNQNFYLDLWVFIPMIYLIVMCF